MSQVFIESNAFYSPNEIMSMPRWEREARFTEKDKEAIDRAKNLDWTEINVEWAESPYGMEELRRMILDGYHKEEMRAGMI